MNRQTTSTIIVGAQWGDEGKGKITDIFAEDAEYVVRFQGGNNAGHTLVVGGETYKLHLIPSGVLYPHTTSVIGTGVLVDPKVLLDEIADLERRGVHPRLLVSERAHVILPYHIAMDAGLSAFQGGLAAGSTGRGIAPCAADKMYRHGIRMGDLLHPDLLREKLHIAYAFNASVLAHVFQTPFATLESDIFASYLDYGRALAPYIADTELELSTAYRAGKPMLFEGAQAMSLDPDHGMYPHTTSTNTVAPYAGVGAGIGLHDGVRVIGVVKAYPSRVGTSPFVTELPDAEAHAIREKGHEYGTTTGRPRRIGWLDMVQVRQAVRVSGITELALMKLDVLGGLQRVRMCDGYDIGGTLVTEMPADLGAIRRAKPVYMDFPGWADLSPSDILTICRNGFSSLPCAIQAFVRSIEQSAGCPVTIMSLGPAREETLYRAS